jgi:ABC-type nitrate/sulfonate/bicarbonate transport system substrate-binding protein
MDERPTRRAFVVSASAGVTASALIGRAALASAPTPLKVVSFAGLSNVPIFAAQKNGLFAKYGLIVDLMFTPNSKSQREGLASGAFQIIHTAADNAVAMVELAKDDVIIVVGGDNGFNRIFTQPEITSLADLRGKTLVVDAPNTAFALLLYKVLKEAGLNGSDYKVHPVGGTPQRLNAMLTDKTNAAAGILNPPLSFKAAADGLKDMGSATKAVGAYQSGSVVVMRSWAKANSDTLIRYIKAIVEGYRWVLDPANMAAATALLADRLKLSGDDAVKCYAVVTDPVDGFAKDAKFSMQGFENVLKLRAEIEGEWGGQAPAPDRYIDLSYYNTAVASL